MVKLAKQREWVETALGTVSGLNVNTNRKLDFESQVSKIGVPIATAFSPKFRMSAEGNVLKWTASTEIWVIDRADGDIEQVAEDIVNALEDTAYPDYYESGDPSRSPGNAREYDGQIWDLTSDEDSGNIIMRLTITVHYINISER